MTRWKAAGTHLIASAVVIGTVTALLIGSWYGWELFKAMGAVRLVTILACTDIAIGPLLTLLVYKAGKKSLRFDLSVIVLLQLGFLAYGLNIVAQSRPVFMVGLADRFDLVFANDLDPADLAKGTAPEYRTLSWSGPRLVGGALGRNSKERFELSMSGWAGKDIHLLPERYVPFPEVAETLAAKMAPASELAATSEEARGRIERFAASKGLEVSELATLAIASSRGRATMMMRAKDGEVLGPLALDPWPDLNTPPK